MIGKAKSASTEIRSERCAGRLFEYGHFDNQVSKRREEMRKVYRWKYEGVQVIYWSPQGGIIGFSHPRAWALRLITLGPNSLEMMIRAQGGLRNGDGRLALAGPLVACIILWSKTPRILGLESLRLVMVSRCLVPEGLSLIVYRGGLRRLLWGLHCLWVSS